MFARWLSKRFAPPQQPPAPFSGIFRRDASGDVVGHAGRPSWHCYKFLGRPRHEVGVMQDDGGTWERAFMGATWYTLWATLVHASPLPGCCEGIPGTGTGEMATARFVNNLNLRCPAHMLFEDGMHHRVALEVKVDKAQKFPLSKERPAILSIYPCRAVSLSGIMAQINAPPAEGEERWDAWDPAEEALPPGAAVPELATANVPPPRGTAELTLVFEPGSESQ